jgi:hypothetical protein
MAPLKPKEDRAWAPVKSIALCTWNTKASFGRIRLRVGAADGELGADALTPSKWRSLFDGKSLACWRAVPQFPVPPRDGSGEGGEVAVEQGRIVLDVGHPVTAIAWQGAFPKIDYEVDVEVARLSGEKDFCILVFPVGEERCTLALGAWKPPLIGLDAVDGRDPRHNGTGVRIEVKDNRPYAVRLRVTRKTIEVWVDGKRRIALRTAGRRFSANPRWAPVTPFGIAAAWATRSAISRIALREL